LAVSEVQIQASKPLRLHAVDHDVVEMVVVYAETPCEVFFDHQQHRHAKGLLFGQIIPCFSIFAACFSISSFYAVLNSHWFSGFAHGTSGMV
jgi:hypothetical protein